MSLETPERITRKTSETVRGKTYDGTLVETLEGIPDGIA